ncbi:MAG: hypothetical protein Q8S21_03420 [Candidatus Paracaedibacteraceae bacterium]|nr:hypothetical protein [Candidatus Paracaedibacteraceae bacterium]
MIKLRLSKFEPLQRIEFAFVLLPDNQTLNKLHILAQKIDSLLQSLSVRTDIPHKWGLYCNQKLKLPHLSIGQYGILGTDIDILDELVKDISARTPIIKQKMNTHLTMIDGYIFFDSADVFEHVNENIRDAYIGLRECYMKRIHTKFPITQMTFAKKKFCNDKNELALIDQHFQNWGTPEYNRMRPHFTMHYHPPFQIEEMQAALNSSDDIKNQIKELSNIDLIRIGVVPIDTFGNPMDTYALSLHPLASQLS